MLIPDHHLFLSSHDIVKENSLHFLKLINCSHIIFYRVYKSNEFVVLGTNPEWIDLYYNKYHINVLFADTYESFKKFDYLIWDMWPKEDKQYWDVLHLAESKHSIYHWFTIVHKREDYVDTFSFCTNKKDIEQNMLYLAKLNSINNWCDNFKRNSYKLIDTAKNQKISFMRVGVESESKTNKIEQDRKLYISKNKYITFAETKVMTNLKYGYTNKEIARNLCLSPRTVEHHIKSIKNKTGIMYKSQLIRYAQKLIY